MAESLCHISLLTKVFLITTCLHISCPLSLVQSVFIPQRMNIPKEYDIRLEPSFEVQQHQQIHENEPDPAISIVEGDSIDVLMGGHANVSLNLNRPLTSKIEINVEILSRPDLLRFTEDSAGFINSTNLKILYEPNNFGDRLIVFDIASKPGHAEIICHVLNQPERRIDDNLAYVSVNIARYQLLDYIIHTVGWMYFFAWSLSFYFQVILNYQRKSVIGLNFDFLALNLLGFTCYSIYNGALLFSREVQKDYYSKNSYTRIPVEWNDLFFALHAFVISLVTVIQCFIYQRGNQRVSVPTIIFLILAILGAFSLYISHLLKSITILSVCVYLSYVKLSITLIKYTPQAYMNYKRKATTGWSIHNILLDFTGGLLSIAQMFLIGYNYDDWIAIFGNFTKFGLGAISIAFDILFLLQHYYLYKNASDLEVSSETPPEPVINQSIRSSHRDEDITDDGDD